MKKSPPEVSTTSEQANLLCTLPRTTLLSKAPLSHQQRTGFQPMDMPPNSTPSMQVTVNPYSYTGLPLLPNSCDTPMDNEESNHYASVVYSSSPTMSRRLATSRGRPGHQAYLSPQLARLNTTLRPTNSCHSANGSPVHRYHNQSSVVSSTTTLSSYLSPRSGRYPINEAAAGPPPSYDPSLHHVYCEIPVTSSSGLNNKQLDRLRHKSKMRPNHSSLTDEADFYGEDTTQCDLHNISDLSDDELQQQTSFSELSFHSKHSGSPKHYPGASSRQSRLNNGSPSHKKRAKESSRQHHQHLSPPPLKCHTKEQMSLLPATDV